MAPLSVIVGLLFGAFLWKVCFVGSRFRYWRIPGPVGLPLVGNLNQLAKTDIPVFLDQLQQRYGHVCKYWFGSQPIVLISEPNLARKLLVKCNSRPRLAEAVNVLKGQEQELVNQGIVWVSGQTWRTYRKPFDHSLLRADSLAGYLVHFDQCAQSLVRRLSHSADSGQIVELWDELGRMTLAAVGTCAYGVDFHTLDDAASSESDPARPLVDACKTVFALYRKQASPYNRLKLLLPWLSPLITWLAYKFPDKALTTNNAARSVLCDTSRQIMAAWHDQQGRQQQQAASQNGSAADATQTGPAGSATLVPGASPVALDGDAKATGGIQSSSFLAKMLSDSGKGSEEQMSEMAMVSSCVSFIAAGYETTASTLGFCIHLLARHPEAEARLVRELSQHLPSTSTPITIDTLQHLPYTEAVVKEALRLYPTAPQLTRLLTEPTDCLGYHLPAGTWINTPIWTFHRSPLYWPRADDFLPERFLPEGESLAATNPNVYTPFGAGPRMCAGYKFAMQEAMVALARLYQHYSFQLQPNSLTLTLKTGLTMAPVHPVNVTLSRRG